jgi:hypothetical protein
VEGGKGVSHRLAGPAPGVEVEFTLGRLGVTDDVAFDELHHVEGPTVYGIVLTQTEGGGDGNHRRTEGANDPVLAGHVVGRGQDVTARWATQGQVSAGAVGHPIGEVGTASGDEGEPQRRLDPGEVVDKPFSDPVDVDALDVVVTGAG